MTWKHALTLLLLALCSLLPVSAEEETMGLSAEEIAALPQLALTPLEPREDLMYDRRYMKVTGATDVYDAPNGTVVRYMDPGYVFITSLGDENGWTRINRTEWVPSEVVKATGGIVSHFTGLPLPADPLPHPIGWVLVDTAVSAVPGVEADAKAEGAVILSKYDRINIYSSTTITNDAGEAFVWYQIGADQWIHQYSVSMFTPLTTLPEGVDTDIWFAIDLYEQNITLYRGLTPVFVTLVGTGLPRWPTYEGLFHIYYRSERENMSWGEVGDDYYLLEEVPWTMYFDEGRALHGAYWHNSFGYRRSHGCVNMSITDAHYMYQQVAAHLGAEATATTAGPAVYVFSSGVYTSK